MRGRYIRESDPTYCYHSRDYEITGYLPEFDAYAVIDESGRQFCYAYLYDVSDFVITENTPYRMDLEEQASKVGAYAIQNGYVAACFVRTWKTNQDIYELFTLEQCNGLPGDRYSPVLVSCSVDEICLLDDKEVSEFTDQFGHYFMDEKYEKDCQLRK